VIIRLDPSPARSYLKLEGADFIDGPSYSPGPVKQARAETIFASPHFAQVCRMGVLIILN
jgi:hypothetical protein